MAEVHLIAVAFALGIEAGVEAGGDAHDFEYEHSTGLSGAEGTQEGGGGVRPRDVEVTALSEAMDSGIGPSAAMDGHRTLEDARETFFEEGLHGPAIGLHLPAGEVGAFVGDGREEAFVATWIDLGTRHRGRAGRRFGCRESLAG